MMTVQVIETLLQSRYVHGVLAFVAVMWMVQRRVEKRALQKMVKDG